jgi:hypothetical protein
MRFYPARFLTRKASTSFQSAALNFICERTHQDRLGRHLPRPLPAGCFPNRCVTGVFSATPKLVRCLLVLRNAMVSAFGLKSTTRRERLAACHVALRQPHWVCSMGPILPHSAVISATRISISACCSARKTPPQQPSHAQSVDPSIATWDRLSKFIFPRLLS